MTIDDFEKFVGALLSDARARGISSIDAGARDLYWTTADDDWCAMNQQPELGVGSLDDDISEIEKSIQDPSRRSVVDFDRCAAVLRLLGIIASS